MIRSIIISGIWLLLLLVYYMSVGGAVALALLILSVVILLYCIWTLSRTAKALSCTVHSESVAIKYEPSTVDITVQGGHKLIALTAKVHICVTHTASKTEQMHVVDTALSERTLVLPIELQHDYCGQYEIAVTKIELFDLLQLFKKQVAIASSCQVIVKPVRAQPFSLANTLRRQQGQNASVTNRLHEDGEERAQLKLYSPGDQVKKIHWKLSSKLDELYVQQFSEPQKRELVVSIDGSMIQGDIDVYDHMLENTAAIFTLALQGERVKFVHVQQEMTLTNEQEIAEVLQSILQKTVEQLSLPAIEQQCLREQYPSIYIVTRENSSDAKMDEDVRSKRI